MIGSRIAALLSAALLLLGAWMLGGTLFRSQPADFGEPVLVDSPAGGAEGSSRAQPPGPSAVPPDVAAPTWPNMPGLSTTPVTAPRPPAQSTFPGAARVTGGAVPEAGDDDDDGVSSSDDDDLPSNLPGIDDPSDDDTTD